MTQRERVLATGLVVILGLAGSLGVLYVFAFEPLKKVNERVAAAHGKLDEQSGELNNESALIGNILKVNPRLQHWADISLSPRDPKYRADAVTESQGKVHREQLQVKYGQYLRDLLEKNKFKSDSISINLGPIEKQVSKQRGAQPTMERLTFNVVAKGDLDSTQKMLKEFYKTPLMHQVRSLTLDHLAARTRGKEAAKDAPEGLLEVKMTVQAMLIPTAKPRTTLEPEKLSQPLKVLPEERDYSWLTKKNPFTGIPPEKRKGPSPVIPKEEDPSEVIRFVKLTMVWYNPDRNRWEATMYDQARGGPEKKLNAGALNGLAIYDRYDNTVLDAKVVHVSEKQLIFKEKDKFYRMYVGDFLGAARSEAMTTSEVKELGLTQ